MPNTAVYDEYFFFMPEHGSGNTPLWRIYVYILGRITRKLYELFKV